MYHKKNLKVLLALHVVFYLSLDFTCNIWYLFLNWCFLYTVKPEQTTTSEEKPPVYYDYSFEVTFSKFWGQRNLWKATTCQQRPLFLVPRVVVVHRFDCIFIIFSPHIHVYHGYFTVIILGLDYVFFFTSLYYVLIVYIFTQKWNLIEE